MGTNAKIRIYPAGNYLLKFNNENCRARCVICSKLTKKTPEHPHWREDIKKHWRRFGVSIHFLQHFILEFREVLRDQSADKYKLWNMQGQMQIIPY